MEYAMAAMAIMPLVADAAAVVSTVRTTVQTARWVGSWAAWALSKGSPVGSQEDDSWLFVEPDQSVSTEIRFVDQ